MKNSPTAWRFLAESYPCASHRSGIGDSWIVAWKLGIGGIGAVRSMRGIGMGIGVSDLDK